MKKHIICCGNIAFDLIPEGESAKSGMTLQARPGGSVLNTVIHLSRLGLSVSMLTKTGKDFLGDTLLGIMRRENIRTDYVIQDSAVKTGLAVAELDRKGDSSYLFYKSGGERTAFKKGQIPFSLFKKADVFHTASTYTYLDFTFENTLDIMKLAKKEDVFVSYDPNWRDSRIRDKKEARDRIKKLLPYVDLLKLSKADAVGITGSKTLSGALRRLPPDTVITLGEKGSFIWDGKKKIVHPAFKVGVVDTIGAGDGFTAGLIYRYCLKGKEAFWEEKKENLAFASAVAALVCKGRGATQGLKSLQQVRSFLKRACE
ncbi:MAG: hypothetical protein DRP85_06935 [Candidatus Makaraimicrobium thalassicum]|nr:MAG: hypothetical protein DRP85_06935 [Candidatus Omnitrophota bacterium]